MTANTPILPALTANERGADRGWPDAEIKAMVSAMDQQARSRRDVASLYAEGTHNRTVNEKVAMMYEGSAAMLRSLSDKHAAEIAAAVQAAKAKEREACAKEAEQSWSDGIPPELFGKCIRARGTTDAVERVEAGVREAERMRERCSLVAERRSPDTIGCNPAIVCMDVAKSIRALPLRETK